MNAEDQSAASDATEQPEPTSEAAEQQTESTGSSFQNELLNLAKEEGHVIGEEPPTDKVETETSEELPKEEEEETETIEESEGVAEGVDAKEPEKEEKPERKSIADQIAEAKAKGEKPAWYLTRIAEEAEKKRTANKRAEDAEKKAQELEAALSKAAAPVPTQSDPFIDIQSTADLDQLERSYEETIELAELDPDGLVEQIVEAEKKKSGVDPLEKFTPEQLIAVTKRRADRAIRKQIPERRKYLDARAQNDAQAFEAYPELKDDPEFSQTAQALAYRLLTGQAQREPDILIWVADAIAGRKARLSKDGKSESVTSPEAEKILKAAKTKVAPTPTRTRSFPERARSSSVNLEKANKKLEEQGTPEAAEEYLKALWSNKAGSAKKVETVSD